MLLPGRHRDRQAADSVLTDKVQTGFLEYKIEWMQLVKLLARVARLAFWEPHFGKLDTLKTIGSQLSKVPDWIPAEKFASFGYFRIFSETASMKMPKS